MSISDLFVPADRMPSLTHIRWGIYGPNGAGKTTLASTIPESERVLYVSIDDENLRPVSKLKHYRVVRIRDWRHIWTVYDWLRSHEKSVTTLVWDTWSRVQDLAVGQVCNYHPADPAQLSRYVDNIPKNPHDWRGWGQVGALCSEWQRNFNVLPINILYLMQEQDRQAESEYGTTTRTGPRLTPEALKGIRDSLEVLGRLYVDLSSEDPASIPLDKVDRIDPNLKETRRLFIGQHERYIAKGPTHILGRVIDDPTWERVVPPIINGVVRDGHAPG